MTPRSRHRSRPSPRSTKPGRRAGRWSSSSTSIRRRSGCQSRSAATCGRTRPPPSPGSTACTSWCGRTTTTPARGAPVWWWSAKASRLRRRELGRRTVRRRRRRAARRWHDRMDRRRPSPAVGRRFARGRRDPQRVGRRRRRRPGSAGERAEGRPRPRSARVGQPHERGGAHHRPRRFGQDEGAHRTLAPSRRRPWLRHAGRARGRVQQAGAARDGVTHRRLPAARTHAELARAVGAGAAPRVVSRSDRRARGAQPRRLAAAGKPQTPGQHRPDRSVSRRAGRDPARASGPRRGRDLT